MLTTLHWVDGPWPGKLALAGRPRGGEWLEDELENWRRAGVSVVLSLLTAEEERDLDLTEEAQKAKGLGISFVSFPVLDRQVPASPMTLGKIMEQLDKDLYAGKRVVLHCRQGIGRSGLVAACLLLSKGLDAATAVRRLSDARGVPVPETAEQRRWIENYAATFAGAR